MSRDEWGAPRRRTIAWHDPAVLDAAAATLAGRDFLQAIADGRLPDPPMAKLVGVRLVSVGEGEVLMRCTPDESVYNTVGTIQGGLLCTLLDLAGSAAVHSLLPAGVGLSSIEIKVSFLKPLRAGGDVDVHGETVRLGKRIAFAEAGARNAEGELVGQATTSLALLQPKS